MPTHQLDLTGYKAAIAGGSRGIGYAIALLLAQAGAQVAVCARRHEPLEQMREAFRQAGHDLHITACDLTDADALETWVDAVGTDLAGLDLLISNASGYGMGDTDADWEASFQTDLLATVRLTRAALPWLKQSSQAAVLYVSSIAAFHPGASNPAYAAIKAAISHYATSQAKRLAADRIRVNAIAPGSVEFAGGIWDQCKRTQPRLYAQVLDKIPFGRYGTPEDIAAAALFLLSPMAGWITGQTLCVDGGQILSG